MLEELRPGRFGPIYRGRDESTGLTVALKVIDQPLESEQADVLASAIARLSTAPLQHPSIVPILGAGTAGARVWMAEPWFGAPALDGLMRRHGPQPVADVLLRVTQLAAALDFAAAVGLHHGALHPRDILVGDERIAVSGVGLLQAFGEAGLAVPMQGAYVSPQRREGQPPAVADDVFALAWITYELVCGTTLPAVADLRASMPAVPGVDRAAFAGVLERALSPEADARPAGALAFAERLQDVAVPADETDDTAAAFSPEPPPPAPIWEAEADDDIPIRRPEPLIDLPPRVEPAPASAPAPAAAADLPLRAAEPVHEPVLRDRVPERPRPKPAPAAEYGYWFPMSAALAIGLLMGFASGYVVGQRERIPAAYSAERAVARTENARSRDTAAGDAAPAPTGGRAYTDSVVPPEGSSGQPRASAPAGSAPAQESKPAEPEPQPIERPQGHAPGVLQVESRPRGARVFIDGRLVGTTPVLVQDVRPGAHAVRIDLAGHRRWVTTITLAPGERQRVAASLER